MELNNKGSVKTPASIYGIFTMIVFVLVVLQNRGDQNIFSWFILRGLGMAVFFGIGYGLYMMLYTMTRDAIFDNYKTVIIVAVVIGIIVLAMGGTNSWSAIPVL